jgi:hypothetical protein
MFYTVDHDGGRKDIVQPQVTTSDLAEKIKHIEALQPNFAEAGGFPEMERLKQLEKLESQRQRQEKFERIKQENNLNNVSIGF